jgi:hypothetical protein
MRVCDEGLVLSGQTADALDALHVVNVNTLNTDWPAMAWLALILRHLPDDAITFPAGKWATIQHIRSHVEAAAIETAEEALKVLAAARERAET